MWDAVGAWKRIESGVSDFAGTAAVFAGEGYRICTRRYRCFMRTIEGERERWTAWTIPVMANDLN